MGKITGIYTCTLVIEKSVYLVGFVISIYHDSWSPERQKRENTAFKIYVFDVGRKH